MQQNNRISRKEFIIRERSPAKSSELFSIRRNTKAIKNPSPESIMRVSNKLTSFSMIKTTFQKSNPVSPMLTPIHRVQTPTSTNITHFNLRDYGLNDSQAQIYSFAFKSLNNLEKLNLRGNRLQDKGTKTILESLNKENLRQLDLSNNRIGIQGVNSLKEILENEFTSLEKLCLENVKLSIDALDCLCKCLWRNKTLKTLNLSNNKLGTFTGKIIGDMLDTNNYLEKLDLNWNQFKGSEAIYIFQGLKNNTSLKTLDLSWNPLGQDKVSNSIIVISKSLAENETLIHLNLSNNNFSMHDCEIFAKNIKDNHHIKGLHFEGNYGKIDALGFIEPLPFLPSAQNTRMSGTLISKKNKHKCEKCWICEEWNDVKIEWDPSRMIWNRRLKHFALDKLSTQEEPVYVHIDIDEYQPYLLKRNDDNIYSCTRALPKGKIQFFFTYRGIAQISNQYPVEGCSIKIEKFVHFYKNFSKTIMAVITNFLENTGDKLESLPRPEHLEYTLPPGDQPEPNFPPWSLETSIFSGYIQDNAELLDKCFEVDWEASKITKILKTDNIKFSCKEILRQEYPKM